MKEVEEPLIEVFKTISVCDKYLISNLGDVWSLHSGEKLLQTKNSSGYLTVILCNNGSRSSQRVHRLVAEAFLANPDRLPYVNHKNCIKTHNVFTNLEWTTPLENVLHAYKNDRITNKGENAVLAKISRKTAETVLEMSKNGFRNSDIIEALGLTKSIVSKIVRGITWKELHE